MRSRNPTTPAPTAIPIVRVSRVRAATTPAATAAPAGESRAGGRSPITTEMARRAANSGSANKTDCTTRTGIARAAARTIAGAIQRGTAGPRRSVRTACHATRPAAAAASDRFKIFAAITAAPRGRSPNRGVRISGYSGGKWVAAGAPGKCR